jgi:myogenesis-regulating glycosidase
VLTLGITGYPFLIPPPIGGFINMTEDVSLQPERELYVRWMQVSIFLPVVQFATLPSAFDEAVEKIASELTTLRQTTILPLLQVTKLSYFSK